MAQIASKSCDICMSGPGQNYCQQCGQWFCKNCQTLHLRSQISKHHTFLSGPNINTDEKLFCNVHDENFIFYCDECEIPICKLCIVKNHNKHDMSEINESTEGLQADVEQAIATKIKTIKNILDRIEQVAGIYQRDVKEAIHTLTEGGKQIKQWIDKKVEELISSIEENKTESIQVLQSIKTEFQSDMDMLLKRQDAFTESKETTDVTKRLKELKLIKSHLCDMTEKESPVMPTAKYIKLDIVEEDILKLFEDISVQEKDYSKTEQESNKEESEMPICKISRAIVMLFDDSSKTWVSAGSSQQTGLSEVQIYRHTRNNTFRVVGRKMNNKEFVLNCIIRRKLTYDEATPTFHQWRDQRQVYGLNFANKEDADSFAQAMKSAVDFLKQIHDA